ncbi:MAG: DUF2299 family protein [Candidatus Thorarchaeota archaeon]|nr:DUF2299 family protein [Candidatus Thorarchaeota archaeon]
MVIPDETKIMDWLNSQELKPTKIEKIGTAYTIKIERAQLPLFIVRFNEKQFTTVQGAIRIGPEYRALFTPEKKREFQRHLHKSIAMMNIDYLEINEFRFGLYDLFFDDAFTYDKLYDTIKRITLALITNLETLTSILGLDEEQSVIETDESHLPYFI